MKSVTDVRSLLTGLNDTEMSLLCFALGKDMLLHFLEIGFEGKGFDNYPKSDFLRRVEHEVSVIRGYDVVFKFRG